MKLQKYTAMLNAIEQALTICRESLEKVDAEHRRICEDLRDARDRLLYLIKSSPAS